jgi:hypothetical protein
MGKSSIKKSTATEPLGGRNTRCAHLIPSRPSDLEAIRPCSGDSRRTTPTARAQR